MSALHLTFAGAPGSHGDGVRKPFASYSLFVSVTNGDGTPRLGLTRGNFRTWCAVGVNPVDFPLVEVHRADGSQGLPDAPGVYLLSFSSTSRHWSEAKRNGLAFFVAVEDGKAQGQALHAAYSGVADHVALP